MTAFRFARFAFALTLLSPCVLAAQEAPAGGENDFLAYTQELQELLGEAPPLGPVAEGPDAFDPAPESLLQHMEQLRRRADSLIQEAEALEGPPPPSIFNREEAAALRYENTGEAGILALPTTRSFPFGHATPEVVCVPQRVCDVQLEPGERYVDHRAGDHLNWEIVPGPELPETLPDHVSIRPRNFGLHTNLVLFTTRRTYHLNLRSPEEQEEEDHRYSFDQSVRFYYPDDWVAQKRAERRREPAAAHPVTGSPIVEPLAVEPSQLHFDYRIELPRWSKRRLPWAPKTLFDDGERTFVGLPDEARQWDLPVLVGLLSNGETYPLNVTRQGEWLVVPTVFAKAELRLGTGKKRRYLRLINDRLAATGAGR